MIKSAREAAGTWAQIGEAVGITKQAAHDFYRCNIEDRRSTCRTFTTRQPRVRSWKKSKKRLAKAPLLGRRSPS